MSMDLGGSWCCGVAIVGVLAGCAPVKKPEPATPAVPFSRLFYEPTTGQVGHHMVSKLKIYDDDHPDPNCVISMSGIRYDGTLPPGLELPAGRTYFEGTPWQPGEWDITVYLESTRCESGADQTDYGARTIKVHFSIAEGYYDDGYY